MTLDKLIFSELASHPSSDWRAQGLILVPYQFSILFDKWFPVVYEIRMIMTPHIQISLLKCSVTLSDLLFRFKICFRGLYIN